MDNQSPRLKRVIAVLGNHVLMEPPLDEAAANLFTGQQPLAVFDKTPG